MTNCNLDAQLLSSQVDSSEVLRKLVDDQAIEINNGIPAEIDWTAIPSMKRLVNRIHAEVKKSGLIDYFNYHMDMLERDDLVLLN